MANPALSYILRRNAYRDNSLLLDCFNEQEGRMTVVARFSKKQSSRIKGMLEPFRLLDMQFKGRGEVLSLLHAEEKRRYALKQGALIQAMYLNELVLRLFQPLQSIPEVFTAYRKQLHHLESGPDLSSVMLFELELLTVAGHELSLWQDDYQQSPIQEDEIYRFVMHRGLWPQQAEQGSEYQGQAGVLVSGQLLLALRYPAVMAPAQWQELRRVLDRMLSLVLNGKTLYARQLLGG